MKLIIDIPDKDYEFIKDLKSVVIGGRGTTKTIQYNVINAIKNGIPYKERPQGDWIPITMRPIEEEEKIYYPVATFMFDCPMPEDGQNILVSTKYGVEYDTCYLDDGYYLDSDRDWEEVYAWQPLPEPYKEADNDNSNNNT